MNRHTVQLLSKRIPPAAIMESVYIGGPHQVPALRNQEKQKMGVEKGIEDTSRIWPTKSNNRAYMGSQRPKLKNRACMGLHQVLWLFMCYGLSLGDL